MKSLIFLALLALIAPRSFSQIQMDDDACFEKCSHTNAASRVLNISYYQYAASMEKYDIKYIRLNLSAEAGSRVVSGNALTVATILQPLDSFNIELKNNMNVDSVIINGVQMNFAHSADHLFVPLPAVMAAGSEIRALVYYNGTASTNAVYAGTVGSNGLTYTATLSESYQAREWFPAKQLLHDKIDSVDVWITTSAGNKVGSNGLLQAIVDSPGNRKQYQWKCRYPMSYYMPSFAIGNYLEYTNYAKPAAMTPDSIPVLHYIVDNDTYFQSVKTNLDKTPVFIEKFSDWFTLYPFSNEKYGHAHANIGGGMEHQTMSTMNSFGSTLIAHELGHQWWGDNVTCASWNHIWLNEGFASYCEYLAIEKIPALFPTTSAMPFMQNVHNIAMSQPGGSVYVPDDLIYNENRIFSSRLSYNKGSAIIHTLRFEMQDDTLFFQTLKNYQQAFRDSVATAEDFKQIAEATSGKNLTDFFTQWYYGEGYPTFNVTYLKQGTDSVILVINQTTSSPVTPIFKGLYEFRITSPTGDTTVKAYMTMNNQVFKFKFNGMPDNVIVDPNNWVMNATGTITNGGVIPLQLVSFNVLPGNNCMVSVKWKTLNEQQMQRFEVEYSNDGISFEKAGEVNPNNTTGESSYSLNIPIQGGSIHYYRLKMINSDGNYRYSEPVVISKKCAGDLEVEISPNPVTGSATISIQQPATAKTTIRVYASSGKMLYATTEIIQVGAQVIMLDVFRKLPAGVYYINVQNELGTINRKVVRL